MCRLGCRTELLQSSARAKVPTDLGREMDADHWSQPRSGGRGQTWTREGRKDTAGRGAGGIHRCQCGPQEPADQRGPGHQRQEPSGRQLRSCLACGGRCREDPEAPTPQAQPASPAPTHRATTRNWSICLSMSGLCASHTLVSSLDWSRPSSSPAQTQRGSVRPRRGPSAPARGLLPPGAPRGRACWRLGPRPLPRAQGERGTARDLEVGCGTCTRIRTRHTHTRTQTGTRPPTHVYTRVRAHTQSTRAHVYACTHVHTQACAHTSTQQHACARTHRHSGHSAPAARVSTRVFTLANSTPPGWSDHAVSGKGGADGTGETRGSQPETLLPPCHSRGPSGARRPLPGRARARQAASALSWGPSRALGRAGRTGL